jgi:anti-sigma B factor antagonist
MMNIPSELVDGWALLRPRGDLDLATAPALRGAGLKALEETSKLIVDMRSVDLVDSVALGILLGLERRCRQSGGALRLVIDEPRVRKIFELTRTDSLLDIRVAVDTS